MNRLVILLSLLLSLLIFTPYVSSAIDFCFNYGTEFKCSDLTEDLFNMSLFFPIVLLFAVITHFLPPVTFVAWWRFSRIAIPVILVISLIINLELHYSTGPGHWKDIFDIPILVLMYTIFILGSAWQIYRNRK